MRIYKLKIRDRVDPLLSWETLFILKEMKVKEIINIESLFVELEGLEVNPTNDIILEVPPFDECMKMDCYAFASLSYSKILYNLFTRIIKPEPLYTVISTR